MDTAQLCPVSGEENTTQALIRGVAAGFCRMGCQVGGFDAYCRSAVLPGRLKEELRLLADMLAEGNDLRQNASLEKHADWAETLKKKYHFTRDNALDILLQETGKVFEGVLEDAGVYKTDPTGRAAFQAFVNAVNRTGGNV